MREMAAASPLAVFRLAISITAPCKLQLEPSISLAEIRGNIFSESAYGYGGRRIVFLTCPPMARTGLITPNHSNVLTGDSNPFD